MSIHTHTRHEAWAPKGRQTRRLPQPLACRRISVLPAVSLEGLMCVIAQEGSMKRLDVEYFLEEVLVSSPSDLASSAFGI